MRYSPTLVCLVVAILAHRIVAAPIADTSVSAHHTLEGRGAPADPFEAAIHDLDKNGLDAQPESLNLLKSQPRDPRVGQLMQKAHEKAIHTVGNY
ncbi:hypothetical protein FRB97_004345, partial [Tulasnella sp. 331]